MVEGQAGYQLAPPAQSDELLQPASALPAGRQPGSVQPKFPEMEEPQLPRAHLPADHDRRPGELQHGIKHQVAFYRDLHSCAAYMLFFSLSLALSLECFLILCARRQPLLCCCAVLC